MRRKNQKFNRQSYDDWSKLITSMDLQACQKTLLSLIDSGRGGAIPMRTIENLILSNADIEKAGFDTVYSVRGWYESRIT